MDDLSLFVSWRRPHKSVSARTLSRWVTEVLAAAGVDTTAWAPHSGRAAALHHHHKTRNLTHMQICKLGDWSLTSGVYRKFYMKYL